MNDHVHPIMRAALAPFAPRPATYICNRLVIAEKVAPPIPIRDFDWCAYFQPHDIGDPQGYGASRQEAIDDLREKCNDAAAVFDVDAVLNAYEPATA